jgi:hypothetical protein
MGDVEQYLLVSVKAINLKLLIFLLSVLVKLYSNKYNFLIHTFHYSEALL